MDLTKFILPYPYAAYSKFERNHSKDFISYKQQIYGWVDKNTCKLNIYDEVQKMFELISDSEENRSVKQWILNHLEKFVYINDFSGLDFGVIISEEYDYIMTRFPQYIDDIDKPLYHNYDEDIFKNMDILTRLEWMYENCDFIPIRSLRVTIEVSDYQSYKFYLIKRDKYMMRLLDDYLTNLQYPPNDNVYYFIKYNLKTHSYYLKRDVILSPKNEDNRRN